MKIIFLDIDGVMNSMRFCEELSIRTKQTGGSTATREMIDPEAVARLNKLIEETEAVVVVSSSWRKIFDVPTLQDLLDAKGFAGKVIDVTPDLSGEPIYLPNQRRERGFEIARWVRDNAPDALFVVFDDDGDMTAVQERFIQTSWGLGLLDEHIARARELLMPT
jgi:hypothetical protein